MTKRLWVIIGTMLLLSSVGVAHRGEAASFVIPVPTMEPIDESRVAEILGGLRRFFTYRPLVLGAVAYLLVYSGGNAIMENVSLHAKDVLKEASATSMGTQSFLRFGFKAAAGVLFGWLLTKSNAKVLLLTTTSVLIFGMGWALNVTGWWYLLAMGWLGAGELFGAYFPNYITTSSSKSQVRVNMAYLTLLGSFVGFASVTFGQISDTFGREASFFVALRLLAAAMVLIVFALPAKPLPREVE